MKKTHKALRVSAETIRVLDDPSLERVAGGILVTGRMCSKDGSIGCDPTKVSCVSCTDVRTCLCG